MSQTQTAQAPPKDAAASCRRRPGCLAAILLAPFVFGLVILLLLPTRGDGGPVQFSLVNRSGGPVRIEFLRFDGESTAHDVLLQTYRETQDSRRDDDSAFWGYLRVKPTIFTVEVRYVDVNTGKIHHGQFEADSSAHRVCWFFVTLGANGPQMSECRRSELLDFGSP